MKQKQLPVHEWVIIVSLVGLLGLVVIVSQINDADAFRSTIPSQTLPSTETDTSPVSRNKKSNKTPLTIYLEGAVKNKGPVQIPRGTTYEDLLKLIDFLPEADLSFFEGNKKKLVEYEVVKVF